MTPRQSQPTCDTSLPEPLQALPNHLHGVVASIGHHVFGRDIRADHGLWPLLQHSVHLVLRCGRVHLWIAWVMQPRVRPHHRIVAARLPIERAVAKVRPADDRIGIHKPSKERIASKPRASHRLRPVHQPRVKDEEVALSEWIQECQLRLQFLPTIGISPVGRGAPMLPTSLDLPALVTQEARDELHTPAVQPQVDVVHRHPYGDCGCVPVKIAIDTSKPIVVEVHLFRVRAIHACFGLPVGHGEGAIL
mmetsp:Transcript_22507/g.64755  ORF Transcript_22507/g.64755 Transcript_22507/m.64755 type:complete len:249 (+) Transcript_22507:312-1058(+)